MASGVTPRAPGGGVGVIMAALGLLVTSMTTTLTPASGLLPATSRRGPAPAGPAHHPGPGPRAPPFRNLRLDPDELRLSWDHVTSGPRAACAKDGQSRVLAAAGADHCTFRSLSACHVTNLSVFLRDDPGAAAWILYPESDPARPAAATDLRCRVHDVVRMTCRWGRGPGAPPDVQYRMFYRPASLGRAADRECPRYLEPGGRGLSGGRGLPSGGRGLPSRGRGPRLGCRLDDVSGLPGLVTVTVRGASARGAVGCSDAAVDLQRREVLTPPALTAACNGSGAALVRWAMRSLFQTEFEFDLQINKSSSSEPEEELTSESHFRVPNPGAVSFRVRARVRDDAAVAASAWSRAASVDCRPHPRGQVTALTGGLAALGAGLALLTSLLLLGRRPLTRTLCPPVPRVKDAVGLGAEPGEPEPWRAAPEDCEVTRVTEA